MKPCGAFAAFSRFLEQALGELLPSDREIVQGVRFTGKYVGFDVRIGAFDFGLASIDGASEENRIFVFTLKSNRGPIASSFVHHPVVCDRSLATFNQIQQYASLGFLVEILRHQKALKAGT